MQSAEPRAGQCAHCGPLRGTVPRLSATVGYILAAAGCHGSGLAALRTRPGLGGGGQGRPREAATCGGGQGDGAAARPRGSPPPRGMDGAGGTRVGGTGGGGSARLLGNLKCDKSGKRGVWGREVSPHPTPLTFTKKGGPGRKATVGKVRAEREARRRREADRAAGLGAAPAAAPAARHRRRRRRRRVGGAAV